MWATREALLVLKREEDSFQLLCYYVIKLLLNVIMRGRFIGHECSFQYLCRCVTCTTWRKRKSFGSRSVWSTVERLFRRIYRVGQESCFHDYPLFAKSFDQFNLNSKKLSIS